MKIKKLFLLYVDSDYEGSLHRERYLAFITDKGTAKCRKEAEKIWLEWTGKKMTKIYFKYNFKIESVSHVEVEIGGGKK